MSVMIMMMTDGNVLDDPTVVEIDLTPQLEVTKAAAVTQNNGNNCRSR